MAQEGNSLFQGFQSLSNMARFHGGHGWSWDILGDILLTRRVEWEESHPHLSLWVGSSGLPQNVL